MEMSLVKGEQETPEYIPLNEGWKFSIFPTLAMATEFATARGWSAKPQRVQLRHTEAGFIVEPYDPSGCGCGG